jgi:hypothetical protein
LLPLLLILENDKNITMQVKRTLSYSLLMLLLMATPSKVEAQATIVEKVLVRQKAKTLKDGSVYKGDMMLMRPHGKGKCTYKNGTWFEGNFVNGNRMSGTHYSIDGRVIKVYK